MFVYEEWNKEAKRHDDRCYRIMLESFPNINYNLTIKEQNDKIKEIESTLTPELIQAIKREAAEIKELLPIYAQRIRDYKIVKCGTCSDYFNLLSAILYNSDEERFMATDMSLRKNFQISWRYHNFIPNKRTESRFCVLYRFDYTKDSKDDFVCKDFAEKFCQKLESIKERKIYCNLLQYVGHKQKFDVKFSARKR